MKKTNQKNKIKYGSSERSLKFCAVFFSILFAALMLYPLIFTIVSSMKDNASIYEVPPKLLPNPANSVSVMLDYSDEHFADDAEMLDTMMRDNIVTMFGINNKMADRSIMEIKVYGTYQGKTVFYSRSHQMKLQMERDYGIYSSSALKQDVLLHGDRYVRACESIGYEFDTAGLDKIISDKTADETINQDVTDVLSDKYVLSGTISALSNEIRNILNLESFKYYLQMPRYIYPKNETINRFGFMTFVFNSIIVIGFAMISQVILCSICAFVASRLLSPKAAKFVLMFFMGAMMVPSVKCTLPPQSLVNTGSNGIQKCVWRSVFPVVCCKKSMTAAILSTIFYFFIIYVCVYPAPKLCDPRRISMQDMYSKFLCQHQRPTGILLCMLAVGSYL